MADEKKKTTVTREQIADFLNQTGFVFEMRTNEALLKYGYECKIGTTFLDLEGNAEREIDVIASKLINDINVHFIIECKQSVLDKWIFICTKADSRYFYAIKHLPSVEMEIMRKTELFANLHEVDRKIPLAHNYLCYSLATGKKSDHLQIDECVHKLPKAVAHFASTVGTGRHLFFPVALFSGQLFAVSYRESLVVKESSFLQFYLEFKNHAYKRERVREFHTSGLDWDEELRFEKERNIRELARVLSPYYQIDFVTESGLPKYIETVEKEVAAVRTADWPEPTKQESKP